MVAHWRSRHNPVTICYATRARKPMRAGSHPPATLYDDMTGQGDMLMGLVERDYMHERASQDPPQTVATPRRFAWRYDALAILLCLLGTVIVTLTFGPPLEIAGIIMTAAVIAYVIRST